MPEAREACVDARVQLKLFGLLAVLLIGAAYVPILRAGSLGALGGMSLVLVMWAPGIAGMLARLFVTGSLKGMGWRLRTAPLLGLALVLPLLYCLPVYGPVWLSHLAGFDTAGWEEATGTSEPVAALGTLLTIGMAWSLFTAAGEEIGWRGLLVPQLARIMDFKRVWAISGAIWLAYHVPLIIAADYHADGSPRLWQLLCFALLVAGMSGIMAWLRLASDSLWPPVFLHASHNLIVQAIFDGAVLPGPYSPWITGEFGVGLAVTIGLCAWFLTSRNPSPGT